MIYGRSYEGHTRECEACGHYCNVHSTCTTCSKPICESCALHGCCESYEADYCSEACKQQACLHSNVRYSCADESDASAGYYGVRESWTCRDCGADLEDTNEDYIPTQRKAA